MLMHPWAGYLYGVQLGIAQYLAQQPDWICTRMPPFLGNATTAAKSGLDGIIAYIEPSYLEELHGLGVPVVDVSNWIPDSRFPRISPDDIAIGEMGAKYLIDIGLRQFGVYGLPGALFSDLRQKSFIQTLGKQGLTADIMGLVHYELPRKISLPPGIDTSLAGWLLHLPKPVGIFAAHDDSASFILDTCRHLGIKVPEEICVLGVDNDELISKFTHPPLSSIALPTQKIGFEAAMLLDRMMAGEKPPQNPICLPPVGVVSRQSTDLLAVQDDDVLLAMRFIRKQVQKGVTVRDILREVPVNRRYLERKFRQLVGRTPLQEIRRVRLEKAKELLSGTDLSMPAIARNSGFPNPEHLSNVFHKEVGLTPTAYRKKNRLTD